MRGKGIIGFLKQIATGITPAYAGKSIVESVNTRTLQGSPPRMRGKETCSAGVHLRHGITPAYAGKR